MACARQPASLALLLLVALGALDARADGPAPAPSPEARTEPGWTALPLDDLGLDVYTRRKWRSPTLTLRHRTRADRVVTAARLRLVFAPAKLDGIAGLRVVVNGVRVLDVPAGELRATDTPREIAIDPRLLTTNNDVTLILQAAPSCIPAGTWSVIAPGSTLEVREAQLSGQTDLRWLPLPFVDPQLDAKAEIPFVFAAAPTPAALRAAVLLAGAFALAAPAQLSFPVRVGALPPGDAVVIGTGEQLAALGVDGDVPLGMVERSARHGRLLVVRGRDDELGDLALRLCDALGRRVSPGELDRGRRVALAGLASPAQLTLRGRGDGQIRVPFVLPPATVFWPGGGLPVKLLWEDATARDAPRAKLVLTLNGHYVTTLQHPSAVHAPGLHESRFRLPQAFLRRYNELVLSRESEATAACAPAKDDELIRVLGDSTLDLRGATEFALLPDLGQLVASGFPFTRARDLGATTIVVPQAPAPPTLSTLLALAAELARSAGVVARGAELASAEQLPAQLDRELIVVGTAREQPLLERWREQLPASLADGGGVVAAIESPLHRGRTALVVTAADGAALPDVRLLATASGLDGGERRDVAVIADGRLRAREVGPSYAVGGLGLLKRGMWYLSRRAYLLAVLLLGGAWWLTRAAVGAAARRARRRLTLLILLAALLPRAARADEAPPSLLEGRALFWEQKGRCDKAIEVWQQLLRLAPKSAPAQQGIARCRTASVAAVDEEREHAVAGARALAAAGKYDEAVAAYDKAFAGEPPDAYALEYDETLAGTRGRRGEAQARLAALAARHDDAPDYALAYARSLTYVEKTRRAGIARLERLAAVPAVAARAEAEWRRALTWLDAGQADRPLFDRYLTQHPDDRELLQRRAALTRTSTVDAAIKLGYARLNGGALDDAAETFALVLARSPHEAHALAGLSWVRLKQGRFADARALAEEAKRASPAAASLWQPPLRTALFWSALDEAAVAEKHKDWAAAETALQRAETVSSRDRALVALRRGRLLLAEGRAADAEKLLRTLVPAQLEALPLLVEALLSQGNADEADKVQRQMLAGSDADDQMRRRIRLAIGRARSRAAAARGDYATALEQLRQALELDPSDRDTRIELLYRELDASAVSAAVAIGEALLRERGDDPEVVVALALALDQRDDKAAALATLKSIDPARLTMDGRALEERLELEARAQQVVERGGRQLERRLAELEHDNEASPDRLAVVAAAWWKAGKHERALQTVRKALLSAPSRGARLRCAGILLDAGAGQSGELSRLLDELSAEPQLSAREQRQIDAIRLTQLIHAVDDDRRAGEYQRAFLRLDEALKAAPDAPLLLAALARLEASAGHAAKALAIYRMLVERDPTDLALTEGAALAAVAAGETARARTLAAAALQYHANDPRAFLLAARVALARGDDQLGHRLLELGLERARLASRSKPDSDGDVQLAAARALVADARLQLAGDENVPDEEAAPTDQALHEELARLDLRYAPTVGGGIMFRFRSGDPGLSRLFEVDLPLSLQVSPGKRWGHFTAQAVPVYLNAQTTDLTNPATADVFGTGGTHDPTTLAQRLSNSVWGFAAALRYDYRGLLLELGATPIGFRVVDAVGQAGWQGRFGSWTFGVRGFRSAVTDSVLSYAGLRDPSTGIVWGGVRREGGEIDVNFDPGAYVLHLFVSYAAFTGKRVDANHGGAYSLSGLWRLYRRPRQSVMLGLDAFVMHYAEDLRYFSLGQGGYFSPQFFLLVGLPLAWVARGDGWTLTAGGEAGVNYYNEDPSPLYPADADLQATRAAQPGLAAFYPGVEKVNAYGKLHVGVQHDLGDHFVVDANFDGEFSSAYSQIVLGIALHKAFTR